MPTPRLMVVAEEKGSPSTTAVISRLLRLTGHWFTWGLTRAGILGKLWALDTFEDLANQALS